MLLYRISEKDRTVKIVWSIGNDELQNVAEKENVYTFDDILSQLEDFLNNHQEVFENIRITMMNGLNERMSTQELAKSIEPKILKNSRNVFFEYYSNQLLLTYEDIAKPIIKPEDYLKEKVNHKKLVGNARKKLQKNFDEILQVTKDERNFDYSAVGETLFTTLELQLMVIRTKNMNCVYRIADKLLVSFFYEFSYAIFESELKVHECIFCHRHFLGTENTVCCNSEECLAENKKLKNQRNRLKRKNNVYAHETDNYCSYVRNIKSHLRRIAKVSPMILDELTELQKKCKAVVDKKKKECEEFGLPIDELSNTIDEQEAIIKSFRDKALNKI